MCVNFVFTYSIIIIFVISVLSLSLYLYCESFYHQDKFLVCVNILKLFLILRCNMSEMCLLVKHQNQIPQVTQSLGGPDLAPCNFRLYPKLKSLKGTDGALSYTMFLVSSLCILYLLLYTYKNTHTHTHTHTHTRRARAHTHTHRHTHIHTHTHTHTHTYMYIRGGHRLIFLI